MNVWGKSYMVHVERVAIWRSHRCAPLLGSRRQARGRETPGRDSGRSEVAAMPCVSSARRHGNVSEVRPQVADVDRHHAPLPQPHRRAWWCMALRCPGRACLQHTPQWVRLRFPQTKRGRRFYPVCPCHGDHADCLGGQCALEVHRVVYLAVQARCLVVQDVLAHQHLSV